MSQDTSERTIYESGMVDAVSDMILMVVRKLITQPERMALRSFAEGNVTVLLITVAPEDLPEVVGQDGRTARSLRAIVNAAGMRSSKRLELEVQAAGQASR